MISLVLLATSLAATPDECREAYAAVNYREAAKLCVEVLAVASSSERPGLYRLAALSHAALGDAERATQLFASLLALDPDIQLDQAISPKLRAPFDRARANRGAAKAELLATSAPVTQQGSVTVSVEVADGPSRPITTIVGKGAGVAIRVRREDDPTRLALSIEGGGPATVRVAGLDRFGGELALTSLEVRFAPELVRPTWKPWAVVAGVVLAGAVASAVWSSVLYEQAKSQHFASEAAAKLELSHGTAVGADIGFGVGGALGLVTLILLLVGSST